LLLSETFLPVFLSSHFNLNIPYLKVRHQSSSAFKTIEPFFGEKYIKRIENTSASSLLYHSVLPTRIRRDILSKIRKVHLVISHCDQRLAWVRKFISGYEDLIKHVWVFSKCGQNVTYSLENAELLRLPNVGGASHTYAYWINNHFYNTSNPKSSTHDIVVFLKDSDQMLDMQETGGRNFGDLLSLAVSNGLGCMLMTYIVNSYVHDYKTLRTFSFDDVNRSEYYVGTDAQGKDVPFLNKKFQNLGEWIDRLKLGPLAVSQNIVPVCYGGNFAVTTSRLTRHSKRAWKAIEESLSRGDDTVEQHYAERIWAPLLSKPFTNKSANAIWGLHPIVREDPYFYRGLLTLQEDGWWFSEE
jgi:hypothetical protein